MAVEAVLLSHIDRKDVVNIIPKMSLGGREGGRKRKREREKERLTRPCLGDCLASPIPNSNKINQNKAVSSDTP